MIRAFVALEAPPTLLQEVARLGEELQQGACARLRATWVHPARMHVTARFLGDVDEAIVPALARALVASALGRDALELRASALGAFPDAARARVLVVPLTDAGEAAALVGSLEDRLEALGLPRETRAYVPHLTLARLRAAADVRELVAGTKVEMSGRARRLVLFQSELGPKGPTYTELAHADLGTA